MGNIARPQDVKDSKKAASQLLAALLLHRNSCNRSKAEDAQDLQELYRVPKRDGGSALGSYWQKLEKGTKVLGDETMSRVAHEAVLRGHIAHRDYPLLRLNAGGVRLLQMIGNLLVEAHAGAPLYPQRVDENLRAWEQARNEANQRRADEREALRDQLEAVGKDLTSALRSVNELVSTLEASVHCEVPYRPSDPTSDSIGEGPYVSAVTQFSNMLASLRASLSAGCEAVAEVSVRERDLGGFGDLPLFEPQGPNVTASLDFMHEQVLDMIAIDWDHDYEEGEIVVEDLGDCLEPVPLGSEPKQLVCVRRADAPPNGDDLKCC